MSFASRFHFVRKGSIPMAALLLSCASAYSSNAAAQDAPYPAALTAFQWHAVNVIFQSSTGSLQNFYQIGGIWGPGGVLPAAPGTPITDQLVSYPDGRFNHVFAAGGDCSNGTMSITEYYGEGFTGSI